MHTEITEASITGLFRLLLILLISYYAFTFFFRYVVPVLLKNYVQNQQQKYSGQDPAFQQNTRKEGEVTIQYKQDEEKKGKTGSDEEYVDYEEVKD